jgi:hypothetical protein
MDGMKLKSAIQMLALFLAGCAGGGNGDYPSLAKRPIESRGGVAANPPVVEAVADDPAVVKEVDGLMQRARAGAAAFDAAVGGTQERVSAAAGSVVSSEAWVAAQLAISNLESQRYDSVFALASLDTLYVSRLNAIAGGEAQGSAEVIDRARSDALAIVDRQNDVLDGLRDRLANP